MSILKTVFTSIFRRETQTRPDPLSVDDFVATPYSTTMNSASPAADAAVPAKTDRSDNERKLFGANPTPKDSRSPKLKSGKGRPYKLVGTLEGLQQLIVNPPSPKTTIFLTGELVILSGTEENNLDNYSRQTDRITKSLSGFGKRTIPFTLKVWLHKNAIDAQHQLKRYRFCFAIDQYLHYGREQKSSLNLVTGSSGNNETIIHVFTFEKGSLIGIDEKVLPSTQHHRFNADYAELLNALRRDALPITIINPLSITIVNPLPNPERNLYSYVNSEIYNKPIQYFITDETAAPRFLSAHGIPIAVIAAAIIIYIAALVIPYGKYNLAAAEFQKVAASIPQTDQAFGSSELKTMQERRLFLTEARTQQQTIKLLRDITYALSTEGIIIKTIELDPKKQKPEDPDISIAIQTKRFAGESTLEQAKPLLVRLSSKLGITLRLAHNAFQDQKTTDGDFIQFNIEGNFKGQSQS